LRALLHQGVYKLPSFLWSSAPRASRNTKAFGVANMSAMTKAPRSSVFRLEAWFPNLEPMILVRSDLGRDLGRGLETENRNQKTENCDWASECHEMPKCLAANATHKRSKNQHNDFNNQRRACCFWLLMLIFGFWFYVSASRA